MIAIHLILQTVASTPTDTASWIELRMLEETRRQVAAAWIGTIAQVGALVAAAFAAVYAKGAYVATTRQVEIAHRDQAESRRADAARMVQLVNAWLTFHPGGRLGDHRWRETVITLPAVDLARELSNNLREYQPGDAPAEAQVLAYRLGGASLARYRRVLEATDALYTSRVEWGKHSGLEYVGPQGVVMTQFTAHSEGRFMREAVATFFDTLQELDASLSEP